MRCFSCHYDLRKLCEHRCPECGREFHPKNRNLFLTDADLETSKGDRTFRFGVLAAFACIALVLFILMYHGYLKT